MTEQEVFFDLLFLRCKKESRATLSRPSGMRSIYFISAREHEVLWTSCSDRSGNVALLKLPVDDSAVLRLKYAHGYSGAEIAAILDLTEAAVRKRISRAKKRLAKLLAEGDEV